MQRCQCPQKAKMIEFYRILQNRALEGQAGPRSYELSGRTNQLSRKLTLRPVHVECVDFLGADIAGDKGRIVGSNAKPGPESPPQQMSSLL